MWRDSAHAAVCVLTDVRLLLSSCVQEGFRKGSSNCEHVGHVARTVGSTASTSYLSGVEEDTLPTVYLKQ